MLGPLREQFGQGLSDELGRVQQPIYGEGQQASFLNQLNDLTQGAQTAIGNRFAATGGQRSGSAEDQLTQSELFRGGQASQFFSQLPFLEEQARRQSTSELLGKGLNFVGRGVTNQTATNDLNQTTQQTSQQDTQSLMDQDIEGPGFWKSLAGAGGSLLGGLIGNNPSDPFGAFRKNQPSRDSVNMSEIPLGAGNRGALDLLDQFRTPPFAGR